MRIGYQTSDEVHWYVASQLAHDCGARLECVMPLFQPPPATFDALLIDLDYLPGELRDRVVGELLRCVPIGLVAVHSYNLDDEQITRLRRSGVLVYRGLGHDLFAKLAFMAGYGKLVQSKTMTESSRRPRSVPAFRTERAPTPRAGSGVPSPAIGQHDPRERSSRQAKIRTERNQSSSGRLAGFPRR